MVQSYRALYGMKLKCKTKGTVKSQCKSYRRKRVHVGDKAILERTDPKRHQ